MTLDTAHFMGGRGVFQLKEDSSAAERIGLRPIPFDEIGLYRDEFRKELPPSTVREARATGSAGK